MTVNMFTKKTVVIYLAAVFVAGLLAGGAAGFSLGKRKAFGPPPRPKDMATHICGRLKSKLDLTPDQVKEIEPLVNETAAELELVNAATAERITQIFQKLNERQTRFLTDKQKALLADMERERQESFRKFKARPGPPPGPPPFRRTN
jgi:hypothetical protein